MAAKRALITGITGQDGSYLAELLLARGYEVHGMVRRSSSASTWRLADAMEHTRGPAPRLSLHDGDLTDGARLARLVARIEPDEIYNLGAQSQVHASFETPAYTADVVALGCIRLLEAVRELRPACRFYQASSSEMFGEAPTPQSERTPFRPRSPYAVAKLHAHWSTINYREAYGLHACTGILFNHESPRRGEQFITRKITRALPRLLLGQQRRLYLGNLHAKRDWGHARDYMAAVHAIMQHSTPDDFVIGTAEQHTVADFLDRAGALLHFDWRPHVRIDPALQRPCEVDSLCADTGKARRVLGWRPCTGFDHLIRDMVVSDLAACGLDLAAARRLARRLGDPPPAGAHHHGQHADNDQSDSLLR